MKMPWSVFAGRLFLAVALVWLPTRTLAGTEPAGPMVGPRQALAAVPLADGRALVAGGFGNAGLMQSAEIFDPASNLFSVTGSLVTPRGSPAAAKLPDGRALILGGSGPGDATSATLPLASAEIFDPVTGAWTATGSMAFARRAPRALPLPDGRVLVIGGDANVLPCEIYDPATGTFSTTGSLTAGRADFAATVFPDGRVFVAGGSSSAAGVHHASAEVWDPATGVWTAVGSMAQSRVGATATALQSGGVLVSGGQTGISTNIFVGVAELFDPTTGTFTATGSLNQARAEHVAARLVDGRVIAAGGFASIYPSAIEIYDPVTGTWSVAGALTETRRRHAGVVLGDGALLVAGGFNSSSPHLTSAEIIDPTCMANTPTLSATSASLGYTAGAGSVSVTHLAGCSWRATGANSWLAVTAGAQSWGNGDVTFSVSENTGPARSATLSIAGSVFTVSQSAHPCTTATISPASAALGPAGGTFGISVNIPAGCAWAVTGAPSWMTIPPSGTGSQAINATVAANSGVARSATFTIAGRSFYVSQSAGPCVPAPTISPTGRSIAAAGGNSTVSVTAPAACPWTVTNVPSWITMFTSGTGSTTLSFTVAANPGAARSAYLNVAGTTFAVSQTANLCGGATLTPSSVALPNTSTTGTITLTVPGNCVWAISGVPSWINFTSGYSGTGSKTLTYQAGGNQGPAQSAAMTIAGATLTMTQVAGNCWPSSTISPTSSPTFSASGGSATVTVTAQSTCTWTVTSLPSWATVTSAVPVTGSGTVTFSVAPNTGAARSYTMVIAGSTHYVAQSAGPCGGSSVSPASSPTFATTGGSGTVTVTTQAECTWTVSGLPAWITVTSPLPVTGSGSVSYSVASNSGGARSASLAIAGATHSVAQSGVATYCAARGSTSNYEWIQQVAFAGQTRSTGNNGGYGDFTTSTAAISLARGANAVTVTPGFSSGSYTEYWRVWIDFNGDMTYSDSELVFSGTSSGAIASSFTVPPTASAGATRMRVSMKYGGAATACGSFSYGEVEDYTVLIP